MRIRHGYPHSPFHPLACDGIHSWIVARLCFQYINQMGQLISAYCMLSSHKILRGSLSRSLLACVPCFFPFSFGLPFRCVCIGNCLQLFRLTCLLFLSVLVPFIMLCVFSISCRRAKVSFFFVGFCFIFLLPCFANFLGIFTYSRSLLNGLISHLTLLISAA